MAKAFQCDNCLDTFIGDPHHVLEHGTELCSGCFRTLNALGMIDPFEIGKRKGVTDDEQTSYMANT